MDMNQYLNMFMEESKEHLQAINATLLQLEDQPDDLTLVQQVFRSAHTLKGMSASMGFEDLASLTHEMENVLDMVRNGQLRIDGNMMDVIFESVDALEKMVHAIEAGGDGKLDVSSIVLKMNKIVNGELETSERSPSTEEANKLDDFQITILEQSIQSGYSIYQIKVTIEKNCILKAARAFMVYSRLEETGEIIQTVPSTEDIEQEKFDQSFFLIYVSQSNASEVERRINNISEVAEVMVRSVTVDELKGLGTDAITNITAETQTAVTSEAVIAATPSSTGPANASTGAKKALSGKTIRVDIDRLDLLMNLFSELVIDKGRLEQLSQEIGRSELTETSEKISRVSGNMQDLMLKLRMVPIDQVFNRFPRMIRDLAKDLSKKLNLVITGAETELDRTVVDEIGDPLVHLLRNAVDHGLEKPDERLNQGKSDTGTLSLSAFHSGNHVFIEIQDDGKGIDRDRVLNKALERNIVTSEQAMKMTDQQVYQLLFSSGFSTAEMISDISGRGVGLDVVKSKIESLGGTVTVDSIPGKGSTFSVQLPLTLSIISAMLISMGEERYAVPLSSIVETAIVNREDINRIHGQSVIKIRDKIVPIIPLDQWFGIQSGNPQASDKIEIMILQKGSKWGAIIVDGFIGRQEIVIKPLGQYFGSIKGISGATILGDGRVAMIVDASALIH